MLGAGDAGGDVEGERDLALAGVGAPCIAMDGDSSMPEGVDSTVELIVSLR